MRAWTAGMAGRCDITRPGFADTAADVVWALVDRPDRLTGALGRFGRWAGAAGWTLAEVNDWVDHLAALAGGAGRRLGGFEQGAALGAGWSEGFVTGHDHQRAADPVTGLVTPAVVRSRIKEVVAHHLDLGLDPHSTAAVAVVDIALDEVEPLVRPVTLAILAHRLAAAFSSGEMLGRAGSRILVLMSRTPSSEALLSRVLEELWHDSTLAGLPIMGWIEPLPANPADLEAFLDDLIAGGG